MTYTTAYDVIEHFATPSRARSVLAAWRRNSKEAVVDYVEGHVTAALYRLTKADLLQVARQTDHALADVRRVVAESVPAIVDWRPDFAITHVLHYILEARDGPFTYQDFQQMAAEDPRAPGRCCGSRQRRGYERLWQPGRTPPDVARAAMRWRIGNSYYSFLRELYVIAHLRDRGIDARTHPLADALFRADAWVDRTLVSLYVGNAKFRQGYVGRKTLPHQILADSDPPWRFADLRLRTQTIFGRVHVPSDSDIDALIAANLAPHLNP